MVEFKVCHGFNFVVSKVFDKFSALHRTSTTMLLNVELLANETVVTVTLIPYTTVCVVYHERKKGVNF